MWFFRYLSMDVLDEDDLIFSRSTYDRRFSFRLPISKQVLPILKQRFYSKFGFSKREKIPAVYVVRDRVSGLLYVGSSGDVGHRLRDHRTDLNRGKIGKNTSTGLLLLYKETGEDNLDCTVIFCKDEAHYKAVEQELIDHYHEQQILINLSLNSETNKRNESNRHPELNW